jgi:hypothetical protein
VPWTYEKGDIGPAGVPRSSILRPRSRRQRSHESPQLRRGLGEAEEACHRAGNFTIAQTAVLLIRKRNRGAYLGRGDHAELAQTRWRCRPVTHDWHVFLFLRKPEVRLKAEVRCGVLQQVQGLFHGCSHARTRAPLANKMANPPDDLIAMNGSFLGDHGAESLAERSGPVPFEIFKKLTCSEFISHVARGCRAWRIVFVAGGRKAGRKRWRQQVPGTLRARRIQYLLQFFKLLAAPVKPIRAPDPVKPPAEIFENLLAQAVAFPRPKGRMVGCPIAFDGEHIAARSCRIAYREVDLKSRRADLRLDLIAEALDRFGDGGFEGGIEIRAGLAAFLKDPGFRILKKALEYARAFPACPFKIDVPGAKRHEDLATNTRAGEEDIQAPFAALRRYGAERHAIERLASLARPVADRDQDHVALVPLHVFEILDE